MKILYVSMDPGVHLDAPGGGAVHIRGFVDALRGLGHEVVLLASSAGGAGATGSGVVPIPVAGWNRALGQAVGRANRLLGRPAREHPDLVRILHNLSFRKAMTRRVRAWAPDLIYERYSLWGVASARVAARYRIPYALEVNAPLVYEQGRFRGLSLPSLARLIERRVWRSADLIVAVSEGLRSHLALAGVTMDRVLVVPNGVDPSVFHPEVDGSQVRRRLGLGGKIVIGASGTFKPWHGLSLLLEAFRHVHNEFPATHLLLVGNGPLLPRLEEEVRAAGLTDAVTFTGSIPHEEMPAYLAAMDIAAAPYPRLQEQYYSPLKLFEYMAMGRPIVASRSGQAAQILTDGVTGLLFEPGDRRELADCLRRLCQDTELRARTGKQSAEAARVYTWKNNAARVLGRLDQLCWPKPAARTQEQTVG